MITLHLDPETEALLREMAQDAGQTQEEVLRDVLRRYLEDQEDIRLVRERLASPGPTSSLEEVKRELGLAD
jgi:predicted DNA-binding protein